MGGVTELVLGCGKPRAWGTKPREVLILKVMQGLFHLGP